MLSDAKSGDIFDLFGGNLLATVLSQLINMLGFFSSICPQPCVCYVVGAAANSVATYCCVLAVLAVS